MSPDLKAAMRLLELAKRRGFNRPHPTLPYPPRHLRQLLSEGYLLIPRHIVLDDSGAEHVAHVCHAP